MQELNFERNIIRLIYFRHPLWAVFIFIICIMTVALFLWSDGYVKAHAKQRLDFHILVLEFLLMALFFYLSVSIWRNLGCSSLLWLVDLSLRFANIVRLEVFKCIKPLEYRCVHACACHQNAYNLNMNTARAWRMAHGVDWQTEVLNFI